MNPMEVRQPTLRRGRVELVDDEQIAPPFGVKQQVRERSDTSAGKAWRRVTKLVWLVSGLFDVILGLDFLFRALGVHHVWFADIFETVGGTLGAPFDAIFGDMGINGAHGTVGFNRWGDLMAIVIYSLVAALIMQLIRIITGPNDSE